MDFFRPIFWSVAEPISYFSDPPQGAAETPAAVETAMLFTFFHWGLHAWTIYSVVGVTLRSVCYPLIGDRIYEPIGHGIDVIAVFAALFVWLAVFGGTALQIELEAQPAGSGMAEAVEQDITLALFVMLEQLPWSLISSIVATLLVVTSFVTSSDSATHVVDALLTRGSKRSPTRQRVIWSMTEGAVAAVLLVAGGTAALEALQTASITLACRSLCFCCSCATASGSLCAVSSRFAV